MRFAKSHITFHWLSATLILVMLATGLAYRFELADATAMRIHQITGQSLIVLIGLRLLNRLLNPPAPNSSHPTLERRMAGAVHASLYVTLIAFMITGYVSASAETRSALIAPVNIGFARSPQGELFLEIHYILPWVLLGLFGLHLAGALKHHFWDRDDTLLQMIFKARKG